MKLSQLVLAVVLALVMGAGVLLALGGTESLNIGQSRKVIVGTPPTPSPSISATPVSTQIRDNGLVEASPIMPSALAPSQPPATPTPTLIPVEVGTRKGEESESVLLLYDSSHPTNFDFNFCKIAEYYGLLCKRVALDTSALTDGLLRDKEGNYFKLTGISADTLLKEPPLLKKDGITLIKSALERAGASLFVGKVRADLNTSTLMDLTDGAIVGATKPPAALHKEWIVSASAPEITGAFSGQVISYTNSPKYETSLTLGRREFVTTLITSTNEAETSPIFVRYKKGNGSIFVDAGEESPNLETTTLASQYAAFAFSKVIPLMMAVRYELGDRVWHTAHYFANLTVDDPPLTEPFLELSYSALLEHMQVHNFHTTVAFVPANYGKSQPSVVNLFLAHPDRFSLVQHGNNHDGYEFYKYTVSPNDIPPGTLEGGSYDKTKFTARSLAQQESNITQGLSRMEEHQKLTGIPFDQIMIFPYGISPAPTFALLKKYNYLETINGEDVPLGTTRPTAWDYGMYQANMDYESFPSLFRRHPGTYLPFRPNLQPFLFDLFIGKPALFYSHADNNELFAGGMGAFDPVADQIAGLAVPVEWRSLGYIAKHLYLEKTNGDGSVDVKMYTNDLIISSLNYAGATYHITKQETLNVPIKRVTVNGQEFPYRVEQGLLEVDVVTASDSSPFEVVIHYGS